MSAAARNFEQVSLSFEWKLWVGGMLNSIDSSCFLNDSMGETLEKTSIEKAETGIILTTFH